MWWKGMLAAILHQERVSWVYPGEGEKWGRDDVKTRYDIMGVMCRKVVDMDTRVVL